ncbi:MAG: hypothetical protein IJ086_01020 [Clostridium sp.]|nr:hypothetical protein [Clostridium sp.]
MNNYIISFVYNEGDLTFELKTNYEFKAINKIYAEEKAKKIESKLEKYLKLFYDKESKIIRAIIERNNYFSEITLNNYLYKGKKVSEEEFHMLIDNIYKNYFNKNSILKFEAISYGIDSISER